jgi:O-Antigen ligase
LGFGGRIPEVHAGGRIVTATTETRQTVFLKGYGTHTEQENLSVGWGPGWVDVGPLARNRLQTAQKRAFILLCSFAALNPAVAQIGYLFLPGGVAGLSLMQWFQGLVFLLELPLMPWFLRPYQDTRHLRGLAIFVALAIVVFIMKSGLTRGTSMEILKGELTLYFKYFFWAFSWLFIGLSVRNALRGRLLLTYIVLGVSVDAMFKIIGAATGRWGVDAYASAGVSASFGAEGISGKATVGFLLPAMFLCWYLLKNRAGAAVLTSSVFFAAIVVTYDRTAQVAVSLSLFWCVVWALFLSRRQRSHGIVFRFVVLLLIGGWIYAADYGMGHLTARWTHELETDRALDGSGRLSLYAASWKWFRTANGLDLLFGQGQNRTFDMIEQSVGKRLHTHSDLFDMMSYGGILGLILYAYLMYVLLGLLREIPYFCLEFQIAAAIAISFLVMSVVTGQMDATHAMFTLGASLWCLRLSAVPLMRDVVM